MSQHKKNFFVGLLAIATIVFVISSLFGSGSSNSGNTPQKEYTAVEKVIHNYADVPTYSVILTEIKEDDSKYFQKLTVAIPKEGDGASRNDVLDWNETTKDDYEQTADFVGLTILNKKDGTITHTAHPPGYSYVGDNRYGSWQQGPSGMFWAWYAGSMLWSHSYRTPTVRDTDYDAYNYRRSQSQAYYGSRNKNKKTGSSTISNKTFSAKNQPEFFAKYQKKKQASSSGFSSRVSQRIGRSSVAVRSRGSGVGK